MINKGLLTSNSAEWSTPQALFDRLNAKFHFTLDPCSTHENAKCVRHFTRAENGLIKPWQGERVFMNPPYGREIIAWARKAFFEARDNDALVVGLLPARTDTEWFHQYIYNLPNVRIEFLRGRLKFSGAKNSAPFPSMLVVWGEGAGPADRGFVDEGRNAGLFAEVLE
jgi:site-specific DNA-methyltransferase (adenine-specific)